MQDLVDRTWRWRDAGTAMRRRRRIVSGEIMEFLDFSPVSPRPRKTLKGVTEDAHRLALAQTVNGIAGIAVTKVWGEGRSAAGDGQRFGYHRQRLHRTFSHK